MRVSLHIDGATTAEVRTLIVALNRAGRTGELQVGADGPNLWSATTPKLSDGQYATVVRYMNGAESRDRVSSRETHICDVGDDNCHKCGAPASWEIEGIDY